MDRRESEASKSQNEQKLIPRTRLAALHSIAVVSALTLGNVAVPLLADHTAESGTNSEQKSWQSKGKRYVLSGVEDSSGIQHDLTFDFSDLTHRAPWCGFSIKLDKPLAFDAGSKLRLVLGKIAHPLTIKVELKDEREHNTPRYMAYRRYHLETGDSTTILIPGKQVLDGLTPIDGWQRVELWPDWRRIQYIGVVVEARYNSVSDGSLGLKGIEFVAPDGSKREIPILKGSVSSFEYESAEDRAARIEEERRKEQQRAGLEQQVGATAQTIERLEALAEIRRDDPSESLFLSGAGYKFDPTLPFLGVSSEFFAIEEPIRIDDLIVTALDLGLVSAEEKQAILNKPIFTRGGSVSAIFDMPGAEYVSWPRLKYTYEDKITLHSLENRFPTVRDIRDQTHEFRLLWSTPYLDRGARYRLTIEPAYQFIRRTTDSNDLGPREDVHRGEFNLVLHDEYAQRQFFVQAIYGQGNHRNIELDPQEVAFRGEWRQWYGPERTAFSSVGVGYGEIDFEVASDGLPDDVFRQFDIFGNLIVELDEQGRWRWFNSASFNRTDLDFTSFPPTGGLLKRNAKIDFYRLESRVIHEIIPDVDMSIGLEHSFADRHDFDSIGLVGRVAAFNFGPWRAELGARETFYYNIDDSLTTVFFRFNFAQ